MKDLTVLTSVIGFSFRVSFGWGESLRLGTALGLKEGWE